MARDKLSDGFDDALIDDEIVVTSFTVSESGERLDLWLSKASGMSRNQIQNSIKAGLVSYDGKKATAGSIVKAGKIASLTILPDEVLSLEGEDIPLDIVYEDSSIIVINKQRDLVVHPAVGHQRGTLVHALLFHCKDLGSIAGTVRPGIVHRLDKDTTGLMVVAKNERAMVMLSEQIRHRHMERGYLALVWDNIKDNSGFIHQPIGRHPKERQKMAVVSSGREARTDYEVVWRYGQWTLLRLTLHSGRTHQIRVHLNHIGHPVVGDPLYSPRANPFGLQRQALHANRLSLLHPVSNLRLTWESDPPSDFRKAMELAAQRMR